MSRHVQSQSLEHGVFNNTSEVQMPRPCPRDAVPAGRKVDLVDYSEVELDIRRALHRHHFFSSLAAIEIPTSLTIAIPDCQLYQYCFDILQQCRLLPATVSAPVPGICTRKPR